MNDFETHPRGTAMELKLSRRLAEVLAQEMDQWGEGIQSHAVRVAYNQLYEHYLRQMENGDV